MSKNKLSELRCDFKDLKHSIDNMLHGFERVYNMLQAYKRQEEEKKSATQCESTLCPLEPVRPTSNLVSEPTLTCSNKSVSFIVDVAKDALEEVHYEADSELAAEYYQELGEDYELIPETKLVKLSESVKSHDVLLDLDDQKEDV